MLIAAGAMVLSPSMAAAQDQTAPPPAQQVERVIVQPIVAPAVAPDPAPQDAAPEPTKPTRGFFGALGRNLVDDLKHLPRRNSLYWLAGGAAMAAAAHPADLRVNRRLSGSAAADNFFIPGKWIGMTEVQVAASFVTYFVGRSNHHPRVQHLGMDLLEAQILSEGLVWAAKAAFRRPRPLLPDGTRFAGYSFPSGHATITFASATVLQQHLGWKASLPTYTLAAYVAASRLHDNRHYLSDVVMGSAVGIIIGRSVTWHGRNTYTIVPVPVPGGLGLSISWQ